MRGLHGSCRDQQADFTAEALKRQKTSKRPRVPKRKKTIIVTPQSEETLAPPSAELREKPDAGAEGGLLAKTSTKIARASRMILSADVGGVVLLTCSCR